MVVNFKTSAYIVLVALVLFFMFPADSYAAIALVQSTGTSVNAGVTTISVSWPSATTTGNLLVAVIHAADPAGVIPTFTAPGSWTQAVTSTNTGNQLRTTIYYIKNAASQSSTGTFSVDADAGGMELVVAEYSGIDTVSPLDQTATDSGSTDTALTGTTGTTAQADELLIGGVGTFISGGTPIFCNPTNSFTIREQRNNSDPDKTGGALLDRIVSSTGTYSGGAQINNPSCGFGLSAAWTGTIATFKGAAAAGGGGGINPNSAPGTLRVNVKAIGGDNTFTFFEGTGYFNFSVQTSGGKGSHSESLRSGVYSMFEKVPPSWTKTEGACPSVTITANTVTECSFTYVKKGSIKVTVRSIGGNAIFNFKTTGTGYNDFSITTSSGTGSNVHSVVPGTYAATPTIPSGWTKTQDTCSSITVGAGQTAECSVTATKNPLPPPPPEPPPPKPEPEPEPEPEPIPSPEPQPIVTEPTVPQKIQKTIQTPRGSIATKMVSTIGASMGIALASSFSFSDIFLVIFRILGTVATALGIKKRMTYWGIVYDAVTKQPLDPAQVVLKNLKGNVIATAITDIDGRYGFLVPPGTYHLEAQKTNYAFPSQKLAGKTQDEIYNNVYNGQEITITAGSVLTQNIPLDPIKFDWNEFAKRSKTFMKFYSKWDLFLRKLYDLYFVVGFGVAIISFIFAPYPYNTIILIIYVALLGLRLLGLKPKSFGHVVDHRTGDPLSFAVLKIIMPSTNTQVSQKVCDEYGRYYCLVPKGKYYITIEKKNKDQSYTLVHTSSVIDASRRGIIKKKFEV